MDGFVQNMLPGHIHAMKRNIAPKECISLNDLYDQYGDKHNLKKGEDFINWLRTVKLKDKDAWRIVINDSINEKVFESTSKTVNDDVVVAKNSGTLVRTTGADATITSATVNKMSIEELVNLSVRKARELAPYITNATLLKYAIDETSKKPGRDSLCMVLKRRLNEIERQRRL